MDGSDGSANGKYARLGQYPLSFLLPDGTIYVVSALFGQAHTLRVSPQSWSSPLATPMLNGSAAMFRPGKILMTGGGPLWTGASKPTSAVVEPNISPAWRTVAPMGYGRYQHNLVVLADGDVLAVGGSTIVTTSTSASNGVFPAELWSPSTETWAEMAAMRDPGLLTQPRCCCQMVVCSLPAAAGSDQSRVFQRPKSTRRRTSSAALGLPLRTHPPPRCSETPSRSRNTGRPLHQGSTIRPAGIRRPVPG